MKTVVIVDDEPITRMDLSDMLQELGFQVIGEAADGFDAIELCRAKRPDVVKYLRSAHAHGITQLAHASPSGGSCHPKGD